MSSGAALPGTARAPIAEQLHAPAIVTWNRLEPRPRTEKFDRSLRAEMHDALWMLTRQWQLGEFAGEDAGSPVFAELQMDTTPLTGYAARGQALGAYEPSVPLEARVEAETIAPDFELRVEMGEHWQRLLRARGLGDTYRELFRRAYPFTVPPRDVAHAEEAANREAWHWRLAAAGRAMDGGRLHRDLVGGARAEDVSVDGLSVAAADRPAVGLAAADFLSWFQRLFRQPAADESAWVPERLEYQFSCGAAEADRTQTVLRAEEYHGGHLDWYSFDMEQARSAGRPGQVTRKPLTFMPVPVEFGGMPNLRWWEFEDRRTAFGDVDAHTTDVAKLLLVEFALIYANDWSVVPYSVPAGSLCRIHSLVVTDVFGGRTLVPAAGRGADEDWQRWRMFTLSAAGPGARADERLFIAPALAKSIEGAPIEEVRGIRDDVANMVWCVESTLPNDLGEGMPGFEAATALVAFLREQAPPAPPAPPRPPGAPAIKYSLATSVPENWIPFVPVHVPGSNRETQLQRAAMPRVITGLPVAVVHPRGAILQPQPATEAPYFIHEEEIPRAGVSVTRSYQRARWHGGQTYLWLGRRKSVGRGEGSSGLQFDQVVSIK